MQINVTVEGLDAIDLTAQVGEEIRDYDDETGEYNLRGKTLGDIVAEKLTKQLTAEKFYGDLQKRFTTIRDEEIRKAVEPVVAEAITGAIALTNGYGERSGQTTTMRELVMAEAKKLFTERSDYGRGSTLAQRILAEEIGRAFQAELATVIKAEKEKVVAAVRAKAADLIADAVKQGVGR